MENFISSLSTLSERVQELKSKVKSEEATKQSMVLPLLHILGYDIFNPEDRFAQTPSEAKRKLLDGHN